MKPVIKATRNASSVPWHESASWCRRRLTLITSMPKGVSPTSGNWSDIGLEKIEDARNKAKLENVFRNIDFNSEPHLGQTEEAATGGCVRCC